MSHSSDNNRIYTETVGGVTYGVSIGDIQTVLGLSNKDIGGLITTGATQNRINKWAKYKPTRMNGVAPTDSYKGELKTLASASGQPTNQKYSYGLSMVQHTGLYGGQDCLKEQMALGNLGWEYEAPRGASYGSTGGEYFRFLDFNNYNKTAPVPFNGFSDTSVPAGRSFNIYIYIDFTASDASYLGFSDFEFFDYWYFGIAIWKGNTFCGAGTSSATLGSGSDASRRVDFMLQSYAIGSCTLYPFLTPVQASWSNTNPFASTTKFVAVPTGTYTLTVTSGDPWETLSFTLASSGGSINLSRLLTHSEIRTSFPALYAVNTVSTTILVNKERLYYSVYLQNTNDSSLHYETAKYSMGQTGSVSVGTTSTQIFSSVSNLVITDTSAADFVRNNGADITEWALTAMIYERYEESGVVTYYDVATMAL